MKDNELSSDHVAPIYVYIVCIHHIASCFRLQGNEYSNLDFRYSIAE